MAGPSLTPAARGVTGAFVLSGLVHLARPSVFEPLVPPLLPQPRAWVLVSGVAELVCAVGLLRGDRWAGPASAATLVAVWPGNWWYALTTQRDPRAHPVHKGLAWARLPLQLPMIAAVARPRG